MEKLVILDYTNATVHFYDVDSEANIDESYIDGLGFEPNNCLWMFAEQMEIIFHKEVLK